jgi:hypothetical protein
MKRKGEIMFRKSCILFLLAVMSLPGLSQAQELKTNASLAQDTAAKSMPLSVPVEPGTPANGKGEDEADQLITNRRLRADAGSLSKWSAAMFFNYQGGSVADPLKPERPNIVNGADALTLQNLTGEIGVRYRLTAVDSLTLSTGFFITTPFHDSIDTDNEKLNKTFDETHQKLNVSDPSIKYVHLAKISGVQSVSLIKPMFITNNQQRDAGYQASFLFSQTFMKDVGNTGFSFGAGFQSLVYTFHNNNQKLSDSVTGFYPAAEYVINDTFNLRTVFGFQVYEQFRYQEQGTFTKRKVYQSVGLGISVTRDIFLYPNIQYIPSDIRADRTNIAISANINVF